MNNALDRPIRKFNPGTFQSDDEIISQFVVRQRELGLVLEVLRSNVDSPSCQHVLIVAPRGRGKTMLLARVGAELRASEALAERLFPVRFMEESQEIHTLADFWLEALFHIAHGNTASNPELFRELRATHADLTAQWRDSNIEERARAAVLSAADRMGRKLVFMVENFQALCEDVDEHFGWGLRQTLQSEPQVMLMATATGRFTGLDDARQPFFEMFRIIDLEPLDTAECRRLWNMVSGDNRKSREIRPLRILTGGSPRLIIIVATFARHRSLRQLLEDLVRLVDDHTEYFRSHLEVFATMERRVYLAIIDLWRSSSASEIAARARMDVRKASVLIGRLVHRGAVLVEGTGRRRKYVAAEGLYSIYYKLRRERDEAELVRNFIRFMRAFYGHAEIATMVDRWRLEAAQSLAIREGLDRALAERFDANDRADSQMPEASHADDIPDLKLQAAKALVSKGVAHDQRGEHEAAVAAYDDLVARFREADTPEFDVLVAKAMFRKGVTEGRRGDREAALAAYDGLVTRFGDSRAPELRLGVAKALFNKGVVHDQRGEHDAALDAYHDLVVRFGDSAAPELREGVARALFNKGITYGQRGEYEAELATYDDLVARFGNSDAPELVVKVVQALFNEAIVHDQRGEHDAELAAYDNLVARFGDSDIAEVQEGVAKALFNKGITHAERGEYQSAMATYDDLVARFSDRDTAELQEGVAKALLSKGVAHGQCGEHEAAVAAYGELVARFGNSDAPELQLHVAKALVNKIATHGQREEKEDAVAAADEVVARFGGSSVPAAQVEVAKALLNKAVVHDQRGEREAELAAYEDVVARFGDSGVSGLRLQVAEALFNKGVTHGHAGEHEAAVAAYDDLIGRYGDDNTEELRQVIARALVGKGDAQVALGRAAEALHTGEKLERLFGAVADGDHDAAASLWPQWQAKWLIAHALLVQKDREAAMSAFQAICTMFVADNEAMLREMLVRVPELVAAGVPEHDLVEILSGTRSTADTLEPLIVALQLMAGEPVRAAPEVLEVAADVRKDVEEAKRRASS